MPGPTDTSWGPELPKQTNLISPGSGSRGQRYEMPHPRLQRGSTAEKILSLILFPDQMALSVLRAGSPAGVWVKQISSACQLCGLFCSCKLIWSHDKSVFPHMLLNYQNTCWHTEKYNDWRQQSPQQAAEHALAWRGYTNATQRAMLPPQFLQ